MKKSIIKIVDLEYSYPGEKKIIFKDSSLEVFEGEVVGIIGKNGSGKSTLVRLLTSILQPLKGSIEILNTQSTDVENRRDFLQNISYIAHDKFLPSDFTLNEYCKIYSTLYPNYSKKIETELINRFEFESNVKFSKLSTGNRMKAFLIFAISSRSAVVFADEVTAVLDPENREDFFDLINEYKMKGVTFIVATNIVEDLKDAADKVWFIDKNVIIEKAVEDVEHLFKKKKAA